MGLQLESLNQSSFEQYGPWHFHDIRSKQDKPVDLSSALLRVSSIAGLNDRLSELSKSSRSKIQSKNTLWSTDGPSQTPSELKSIPSPSSGLDLPVQGSCPPILTSSKPTATTCPPSFSLQLVGTGSKEKSLLKFPVKEGPSKPRPTLKRRRPETDVDGPNTSWLSCKKRRLLRQLITSRLSEPFSLPATHILNRECVASGDKRFLKLATILAARRMNSVGAQHQHPLPHPSQSSLLRRQAVMNRFRLRLQMNFRETGGGAAPDLANVPILQQGSRTGPVFGLQALNATPAAPAWTPFSIPNNSPQAQAQVSSRSGGIMLRSSPPGSPLGLRPTEGFGLLRLPSPRLRPLRSPELRNSRAPTDLADLDELDDENIAFPSSEHESRYDDEPDDVYADFGLIFGGGDSDLSDEENTTEHFEDVMDELDGIPWNARC